jgi:hypothetical protein
VVLRHELFRWSSKVSGHGNQRLVEHP